MSEDGRLVADINYGAPGDCEASRLPAKPECAGFCNGNFGAVKETPVERTGHRTLSSKLAEPKTQSLTCSKKVHVESSSLKDLEDLASISWCTRTVGQKCKDAPGCQVSRSCRGSAKCTWKQSKGTSIPRYDCQRCKKGADSAFEWKVLWRQEVNTNPRHKYTHCLLSGLPAYKPVIDEGTVIWTTCGKQKFGIIVTPQVP